MSAQITTLHIVSLSDGPTLSIVGGVAKGTTEAATKKIVEVVMLQKSDFRILMYSHDTFGLGHLRRCHTIAEHLVGTVRNARVLIMTGASIAGSFEYSERVDFEKIPSVIKLRNGDYTAVETASTLDETLAFRRSVIRKTAEAFVPDVFIVDKEPLGLRGEILDTLMALRQAGAKTVLGLRDVMDAPYLLEREWQRQDVLSKLDALYDHIWVYGPRDFYDPLTGLDVPSGVRRKVEFVGFLDRATAQVPAHSISKEYFLLTTGGGGDGCELVDFALNAYAHKYKLPIPLVIVLGPYMPSDIRRRLTAKAADIADVTVIDFDNQIEALIAGARAVVAMGGYNTFCEILSFDKPALIVPRLTPRREQLIRAEHAQRLGLISMLHPSDARDPFRFLQAVEQLLRRRPPSEAGGQVSLDGLSNVSRAINLLSAQDASVVPFRRVAKC